MTFLRATAVKRSAGPFAALLTPAPEHSDQLSPVDSDCRLSPAVVFPQGGFEYNCVLRDGLYTSSPVALTAITAIAGYCFTFLLDRPKFR